VGLGRVHGGAGPRAVRKRGECGTGEPDPGKEMILTRGSGRAVRGEGDAHGLNCGRLTSGARVQAGESGRAGLGSSERERGAIRAEWRGAGRGAAGSAREAGSEKKKKREVMGRTGFGV